MNDPSMLDDLELELRMLPGVRAAGFDHQDDVLFVQLHVAEEAGDVVGALSATRVAARHAQGPVAVEIARWRAPVAALEAPEDEAAYVDLGDELDLGSELPLADEPINDRTRVDQIVDEPIVDQRIEPTRPRLLAVLVFPDTDELEVHLIHDGRRTIGRAPASRGLVGAVDATIEAVQALGAAIAPRATWARALDGNGDGRELVAVALSAESDEVRMHYGLAAGASPIDAAARSTLDALNRQLSRLL
jgi:hypothetical protein